MLQKAPTSPGKEYEPYSQKWEDVDKQLIKPAVGTQFALVLPLFSSTRSARSTKVDFYQQNEF